LQRCKTCHCACVLLKLEAFRFEKNSLCGGCFLWVINLLGGF
jgi:hypothetical protein